MKAFAPVLCLSNEDFISERITSKAAGRISTTLNCCKTRVTNALHTFRLISYFTSPCKAVKKEKALDVGFHLHVA